MTYLLLLVNSAGEATTSPLVIRELREFPGGEGLSVHFRPVRNDLLFESAKAAGRLAYRILNGEGIVRSQLWVEYELPGPHVNVTGRSSDLLFALALITAKWKIAGRQYPAIAATGVLDAESAGLTPEASSAVRGVKYTVEKVAAAVNALLHESEAVIFYPAADADAVATWSAGAIIPAHIRLHGVENLEKALSILGISLEKVFLGNPFRGLEYFDYQHRAIFFGRDTEVGEVLAQLLRREAAGSPGLLVEGASGSGKSSFLRAGVLPALVHPGSQSTEIQLALRERPVSGSVGRAIWRVGLLPPNANEAKIAQSILDCWQGLPEFAGRFDAEIGALDDLAKQRRESWPDDQRFVWLLDQFEELFTLGLPDSLVDTFGRFLLNLQSECVWTLASIRADAVPQLKKHPSLREAFGANEGQYYLASISATALDDVIDRPAQAAGLSFGMGPSGRRVDQILREDAYRDRNNALPLLQFTLYELYQRRSGRELSYPAYEQLGGLEGSVSTTADAVLKAEALDNREISHLFRSLVTVDESGGASRRYAPIAELTRDPAQKDTLLRLVQARLCVTDQREGHAVVAFAHEALLRTWPALSDWLQREAGLLQTREMAQRETRLWREHGQSNDWLAAADKLVGFNALIDAGVTVPPAVREFIDCSKRRVRRLSRVKKAAVGIIASLAIIAAGAGLLASRRQHEAEYQASEALKAQARLLIDSAAQLVSELDVAHAQDVILDVLLNPRFAGNRMPAAISVFQDIRAADVQLAVLSGHTNIVRSAMYSRDGTRVVTASRDKTVRIWDAHSGAQLAVLAGHDAVVNSAAYAPDGTRIVTASADKTARIWDARTGAQLTTLAGHVNGVGSAAYSPDGARIVTASRDRTARIWDARTAAQLFVLTGHDDSVNACAYSPDGARIVTASEDKTARVWDAHSGAPLVVLSGHGNRVYSAMFSPDGLRIVTTSDDKTARIWDARTGAQIAVLSGHGKPVTFAAYSPDGANIVTASFDRARIWDARTGVEASEIPPPGDVVATTVYSPDGKYILGASYDSTARIWDARVGAQLAIMSGHRDRVSTAVYSQDRTRILTSSFDKTVRIWNERMGAQLAVLSGHGDRVYSAAYSPDGTRIVTASLDKTARIWDALTGTQLGVLAGHADGVTSARYSPDGTRIITGSFDKTGRIWDPLLGTQLAVLSGHSDAIWSASYSPDGTRAVTASFDKTARIWDSRTGAQLAVLSGHDERVSSAVYSPDGDRILTASQDYTARIWDAHTGTQLAILSGHNAGVTSAAYSPDGTRILTTSDDKTARVWDAQTGAQLGVLANHGDFVTSAAYSSDGNRIVTASGDATARIWDAHVPAELAAQIMWSASTQMDLLSGAQRERMGLPQDAHVRAWPTEVTACDHAAAAFYDPDRVTAGMALGSIAVDVANTQCAAVIGKSKHHARADFQMGRALLAKQDTNGAKRQFDVAAAHGYRTAAVDLGDLLVQGAKDLADFGQAVSYYERAWQEGVPIAAFKLGHLYEIGAHFTGANGNSGLDPDLSRAWIWYKKGADIGEPNAIARFAEFDERSAVSEGDPLKRNQILLRAFRFYATAAQLAQKEDWPDEAWRTWRYRRATLARVLAREGMMQEVADAFASVRSSTTSPKVF